MSTDIKISELPPAGTITGNELIPVVQNGVTSKALLSATKENITGMVKSVGTDRAAAVPGVDYVAPSGPLGTPSSGDLSNCTNLPLSGTTGVLPISQGGTGQIYKTEALNALLPDQAGQAGKSLQTNGTDAVWVTVAGTGTVTSVDASGGTTGMTFSGGPVTINGTLTMDGTLVVANGGTGVNTLTGIVKGNGTSAFSAAVAGTDYQPPIGTVSGIAKGNGANALTAAVANTDYLAPGAITSQSVTMATDRILGRTTAGSGAIEEISVGSNLTLSGGVLSNPYPGTVISVGLSMPGGFSVSGSPVTGTGTLTVTTALSGILKSSGGNFSAATDGTDYVSPGGLATLTNKTIDGSSNTITNVSLSTGVTGTLPAGNGGTGISSYTVGDIVYASGATTLSALADTATGNVLLSGGVGTAPAYGKVGLTTHVSGTLAVGNGGTGATTLTGVVKGNGTSAFTAGTVSLTSEVSGVLPIANGGTGTANGVNGGTF